MFDIELDEGNPSMRTLLYNKTSNSVAMETIEILCAVHLCINMSPLAVDPYIAVEEFLTANNLPAWYMMDEEESMTGDNTYTKATLTLTYSTNLF